MQIYTKYRLFILVSFLFVLFLSAHANASFENQIIDIRSCSGNDVGETNVQINTDNNKIYLELVGEELELDGFLPILNTTKKTIESKKITFEEFASTENMKPIDDEEKNALIGFKYWYISLVINPTEKSSVITVELLRPDDFNDRKHVDSFAKDFDLNYFSPEVYFSEC